MTSSIRRNAIWMTALTLMLSSGRMFAQGVALAPTADIEATRFWFENDFLLMGLGQRTVTSDGRSSTVTESFTGSSMVDCRLTFTSRTERTGRGVTMSTHTVGLRDIDLDSLSASRNRMPPSTRESKELFTVTLRAKRDKGEAFLVSDADGQTRRDLVGLRARDQSAADKLVAAFRHAVALCVAIPAAPVAPMTNANVISLARAGLSDPVIISAIRRAPARAFDVSDSALISLAEFKVSNAVIEEMMQPAVGENKPAAQTPGSQDVGSKPAIASDPKRAACEGIESLGLYVNKATVIEDWYGKIRNSGAVAKIVVFTWTDEYGAAKQAQIDVGAGQIATPRLGRVEIKFRVIDPIRNFRVVSCR